MKVLGISEVFLEDGIDFLEYMYAIDVMKIQGVLWKFLEDSMDFFCIHAI